jgi:hypothetical protein
MPKADLDVKRAQVSELLGHSRVSITGAYYGSFGRSATPDDADRCKTNVTAGLSKLADQILIPVSADRMTDCLQLVAELSLLDIEIMAKQAHHLWHLHSLRCMRLGEAARG